MNRPLTTLIVDDEPLARERLGRILARQSIEIVGEAENGRQALLLIEQLKPDVVLLDVQMPVMDGFETARHISQLNDPPAIVFCTAYDQYALNAFDAAAIDYLVKPVKPERLMQAYDKLNRYRPSRIAELDVESQRQHLCARIGGNLTLISVDSIYFCRAEHKYVTVVHQGGESLVEDTLVSLEKEFPEQFIRTHRNTLVSRKQILGLEKQPNQQIMLRLKNQDDPFEVSRRNLPQIRKLLRSI